MKKRCLELGCNVPTELAILPRNFETARAMDDLVHEYAVPTVRVLLRQTGISETKIEPSKAKFPCIKENALEWVGPAIFVSFAYLSHNPDAISLAIGVISNYLTELFKGITTQKNVRLNVVVETKGGNYKSIEYSGDPAGLKELPAIVREVSR